MDYEKLRGDYRSYFSTEQTLTKGKSAADERIYVMFKFEKLRRVIACAAATVIAAITATTSFAVPASAETTLLYPVEGGYTAYGYGYSNSYGGWHSGLDIHSTGNDTIYAAESGTVVGTANSCWHVNCFSYACEHYNTYGNYIAIRHSDGKTSYYGHLLKDSLKVSVGDYVNKGDPIATMGSSGYSSGKHLHLEVRNAYNSTINVNENAISYTRSGYKPLDWKDNPNTGTEPVSGGVYNIVCKNGYLLNVYAGYNYNGVRVCAWTRDNSIEQRFRLVKKSNGKWYLYAMCSSNGYNRVLDIYRYNGRNLQWGCCADLWTANDAPAQEFELVPAENEYYKMKLTSTGHILTMEAYNNGNIYLGNDNGSDATLFKFERIG